MSVTFIPHWSDPQGARQATELFEQTFTPFSGVVGIAPGRVNLIGEHTDYNDGLCLPIALPHATFVAFQWRDDDVVRLVSKGASLWEGRISDIKPGMESSWVNYAGGPAWALGVTRGFDAAVASCVPLGAGLSSSAAIECAMAIAMEVPPTADPSSVRKDYINEEARTRIVNACIRAENEVAGAPTGGLDQTASVFTQAGQALKIDFHAGTHELVEADFRAHGLELLVMDTRASHSLTDGQYGQRRAQCEQARDLLGLRSLRQAKLEDLQRLPEELQPRVRHVITENHRVEATVEALANQDYAQVGELFAASHESLRDDYEVSCVELDCVVESAVQAGALAARMTGGGFGGSAIALVPQENSEQIAAHVQEESVRRGYAEPQFLEAYAGAGARIFTHA
ncbi:galactokinase [Gleimia hominis]|uniref:galactokinase n=1 Tax=Gleimia hominis TaxID=595468 RepID=UPI001E334266|nr:galactokinase [Gleimia hominis]WIK63902.1 galactokinase [Gleimia hominis]